MSEDIPRLRLQQAWRECRQHAHYMDYALTALAPKLPLTGASLQSLDAETVQDLDQFVLRFGKLQTVAHAEAPALWRAGTPRLRNSRGSDLQSRRQQQRTSAQPNRGRKPPPQPAAPRTSLLPATPNKHSTPNVRHLWINLCESVPTH